MCCGGSRGRTPGKRGSGLEQEWAQHVPPEVLWSLSGSVCLPTLRPVSHQPRALSTLSQTPPWPLALRGLTNIVPQQSTQTNSVDTPVGSPVISATHQAHSTYSYRRLPVRAAPSWLCVENLAETICSFVPTHVCGLVTVLGTAAPGCLTVQMQPARPLLGNVLPHSLHIRPFVARIQLFMSSLCAFLGMYIGMQCGKDKSYLKSSSSSYTVFTGSCLDWNRQIKHLNKPLCILRHKTN